MKRALCFSAAFIAAALILSLGVSAMGSPSDTMLPDNVNDNGVGNGNEGAPTSPIDNLTPNDNVSDETTLPSADGSVSSTDASLTGSAADMSSTNGTTETSGTTAADAEALINLALSSNGASYRTVRLSSDLASEEEISEYFGGTNDSENKRLNDGEFGDIESASKSVALGGTGRTFRFKFDLGSSKTGITKIVLKNIQDSYSADPLNNRSFDENKFAVKTGDKESNVKAARFRVTKNQLADNSFSYDVTLELDSEAAGRYVFVEAGPVSNAFVLSLDEIQIYGKETAAATEAGETTADTEIKVPKTGDNTAFMYVLAAVFFALAVSAAFIYTKNRTREF